MTESTLLEKTRRVSLWATIASAALLLVLTILLIWGAIDGSESLIKLILTTLVIWSTASSVLVALLVASHVKKTA